jgi:hypothetical protein
MISDNGWACAPTDSQPMPRSGRCRYLRHRLSVPGSTR